MRGVVSGLPGIPTTVPVTIIAIVARRQSPEHSKRYQECVVAMPRGPSTTLDFPDQPPARSMICKQQLLNHGNGHLSLIECLSWRWRWRWI